MFYTPAPVGAEPIEAQAVRLLVYLREQPSPKCRPLSCIDLALEHGVLDPLSKVLAEARHAPKTAATGCVTGRYVISDQNQHNRSYLQMNGG